MLDIYLCNVDGNESQFHRVDIAGLWLLGFNITRTVTWNCFAVFVWVKNGSVLTFKCINAINTFTFSCRFVRFLTFHPVQSGPPLSCPVFSVDERGIAVRTATLKCVIVYRGAWPRRTRSSASLSVITQSLSRFSDCGWQFRRRYFAPASAPMSVTNLGLKRHHLRYSDSSS